MPAPSASRNPYTILGVPPDAEPRTITQAYRRLARQYHPDVNATAEAEERMRQINWAYATLRSARRQHHPAYAGGPNKRPPPANSPFRRRVSSPWNEHNLWRQDWLLNLLVVALIVVVCPLTLVVGARLSENPNAAIAPILNPLVAPGSTPLPSQDIRAQVKPETEWWRAMLTMRPDLPLVTADGLSDEVLRVWVESDTQDLLVETRTYGLIRLQHWQQTTPQP